MSHIYKITNDINNKNYIGYTSKTIQERFREHYRDAKFHNNRDNSILHKAMIKYGIEHFSIENLYTFDENIEDWTLLEQKYICKYNSLNPNGYNIMPGGEKPPVHYGNENQKTKLTDEQLPELYSMLADNRISYKEIAQKTGLSVEYLYLVNAGKYRHNTELSYPIRKCTQYEDKANQIIAILASDTTLSNKKIGDLFGIRPNEVASINHGKKYAYLWNKDFPIRKVVVPDDYEEKQQIARKVLEYKQAHPNATNISIQKECNVSRSIYEKIIKQIYPYNIALKPVETISGETESTITIDT